MAYKLYVNHDGTGNSMAFTMKFLVIGYLAFFLAIGLYFGLQAMVLDAQSSLQ